MSRGLERIPFGCHSYESGNPGFFLDFCVRRKDTSATQPNPFDGQGQGRGQARRLSSLWKGPPRPAWPSALPQGRPASPPWERVRASVWLRTQRKDLCIFKDQVDPSLRRQMAQPSYGSSQIVEILNFLVFPCVSLGFVKMVPV
jgi:hypothetical protein